MYIIECQNCREANQLNDIVKDKTIRCHICNDVIQVGEVKKEVITNINKIDDHEIRIEKLEKPEKTIMVPVCCQQPILQHHVLCQCSTCMTEGIIAIIIVIIVVGMIAFFCL